MKTPNEISIAVLDNVTLFREGTIAALRQFGCYRVSIQATNDIEFAKEIESSKTLPDLCILNAHQGFEDISILDYLNKKWPKISIIVFSFYTGDYLISTLLSKGAKAVIPPDVNSNSLHSVALSVYYNGYSSSILLTEATIEKFKNKTLVSPIISRKEMEILKLISSGLNNHTIATLQKTSIRTIQTHCNNLFKKLNLHTREELMIFSVKNGLYRFNGNKYQ